MAKRTTGKKVDIGIDLTSNELRVAALSRKGGAYVLERFALGDLNPQFFAAGRVADPKGLGERLKEVLRTNGIAAKRAIISLSGKAAITRIIELPKMGAAQTRQAISLQINQYVPFPPGDTVYDYRVLPPRKGGSAAMQEVLLVATRATTVQSLVSTLQFAGIEAHGIKITSLAAWNLVAPKLEGYAQSVGLIDVRDSISELSFFLSGSFRMSRSIELGFNTIVGKIAQLLGVSVAEAEEYLKAEPVDLTLSEEEIDPTEDNRLREAVMSVFASFVTELVRSVRYYESQAARTDRVGKLMILGNIRYFKNIAPYLERETGLEVSEVALSALVQYQQGIYAMDVLHDNASKLVVASGLCTDYFRRGRIPFNLLPSVYYVRAQAWNVVKIGVVLLAIMAGMMYWNRSELTNQLAMEQKNLADVQSVEMQWKPDAERFDSVKSEISAKLPKIRQVFSLVKSQRVWPAIMEELGHRIPDYCYLTDVDFEASTNEIKMSGRAVDRRDIMMFAISLDNSEFFTGTTVNEKTSTAGGGAGAGGAAAGGGGGPAGVSVGGVSARNPRAPNRFVGRSAGEMMPQRPADWAMKPGGRPTEFEMPRLGYLAGRSIEDYFGPQAPPGEVYFWDFDIATKLQGKALEQPEAVEELSVLEEVTEDVLNT